MVALIYPASPNLTLQSAIPLTLLCAKASSKELFDRYLGIRCDCLHDNGILNFLATILLIVMKQASQKDKKQRR